jgi:type VI protein secretion system component VasF
MTSLLRLAAVTVAALSLVVTTGCGSSDTKSSNDYVAAINKAQTDFANNVEKVGSAPSNGSDPTTAAKKTFADLNTAIDKVVKDLQGVKAPDKVKTLHAQLISEMKEFQKDVQAAGASLSSKDPSKILKAQSAFATSAGTLGTRISQTIDRINQKLHS